MPLPPAPTKLADRVTASALLNEAKPLARTRKKATEIAPTVETATEIAVASSATLPPETVSPVVAPPVTTVTTPTPRTRKVSKVAKVGHADKTEKKASKLFVLDTNVLLHDPMSLFRFEEHDIYLPMIVLEELDSHKKGMTEVARNGRQTSRTLDALAGVPDADITAGFQLNSTGHIEAKGKLLFQTQPLNFNLPTSLPQGKADNQILGVVEALRQAMAPREVVLVSKDINMRVKARALGLAAEDYQNDKALEDGDLLYSGMHALPVGWAQGKPMELTHAAVSSLLVNQFVYFEAAGEPSQYAQVAEIRGKTAVLRPLRDFGNPRNAVWGVNARNREQNFAMNLLMNPEIDFVTLAGTAGSGKTLMALAAGLSQVLDERRYTEIIVTRATVSVGEDIGFLPGTEEEKMSPWMGALDDNLEVLSKTDGSAGEWGKAATHELIRSRIKIKSMNFMRGRTLMNKYLIIDEAQNLTPKQMKTLITRAGPGTKIVCMGNLAQIDTPYLTEGSSGLTFVVDRFKGWAHGGHITLARGERSRLADFASDRL